MLLTEDISVGARDCLFFHDSLPRTTFFFAQEVRVKRERLLGQVLPLCFFLRDVSLELDNLLGKLRIDRCCLLLFPTFFPVLKGLGFNDCSNNLLNEMTSFTNDFYI